MAERGGNKYAIEVFHAASEYYRWPNHSNKKNDYLNYYLNSARQKRAQLDATIRKYDCDKALLICITDSQPVNALKTKNGFRDILENIHNNLNWGENYYFGIITGMVDLSSQANDVIYPPIE